MEKYNEIRYRLHFYSDWHCGSGLAAGADMDALVIKDKNNLPYVPGKTIKGLVREAVADLLHLVAAGTIPENKKCAFEKTFGYSNDDEQQLSGQGTIFFTNATLSETEVEMIRKNRAQKYLFRYQSFTALQEDGIADEHSLRKIETVIPCELEGKIMNIDPGIMEELINGLKMIKRLGTNRNRGMGRCHFIINNEQKVRTDENKTV